MTELLSIADVARITGLSEYTIRAAVRDGELKASKLRNRIRIHPDELAAWVDAGRVQAATDLPREAVRVTPRPRTPNPGSYRQAARQRKAA